jgi:hypothetical protein
VPAGMVFFLARPGAPTTAAPGGRTGSLPCRSAAHRAAAARRLDARQTADDHTPMRSGLLRRPCRHGGRRYILGRCHGFLPSGQGPVASAGAGAEVEIVTRRDL